MSKKIKYWLACSGGLDSVVLAHLLHTQGISFGILHCNFQLRGDESNKDETWVRNLAQKLGIPIRVQTFDTTGYALKNKLNTQLAARELRYNWFDEIIEKENCFVLLAHHYDDQIETFFLQLSRGGSFKALASMPLLRNHYVRPLLSYSKKEILELAQKNNWTWREDQTNLSNDYKRNWYRNEVLPWLESQNFPLEKVVPLVHHFQKLNKWINTLPTPSVITISSWESYPIWYRQSLLSAHGLGEYDEKEVNRLCQSKKGKYLGNDQVKVWNEGNELHFVKEEKPKKYRLEIKKVPIQKVQLKTRGLHLDSEKVKGSLTFRPWQKGDKFTPFGMKGEKTVGKFLRDRKVLSHHKKKVQVLVDEENKVLGIFGFSIDDKYKISAQTKDAIWVQLLEE